MFLGSPRPAVGGKLPAARLRVDRTTYGLRNIFEDGWRHMCRHLVCIIASPTRSYLFTPCAPLIMHIGAILTNLDIINFETCAGPTLETSALSGFCRIGICTCHILVIIAILIICGSSAGMDTQTPHDRAT